MVSAAVHSHFCTSQEMRPLILSHWAAASQRCKCGRWSAEPLTLAGTAAFFPTEKIMRNTDAAVRSPNCFRSEKKMIFFFFSGDQKFGMTDSDKISLALSSDMTESGTLRTILFIFFTVGLNPGSFPERKTNQKFSFAA